MAKILLNPDTGAPIKEVVFGGTVYFQEKPWDTGTVFKFEDDKAAQFFQNTFEFLTLITVEDAKKFMQTEKLKCDKCDFTTRSKAALTRHLSEHDKEKELDELGIPVVRKVKTEEDAQNQSDIQHEIDASATRDGLTEGEGLVNERVTRGAIMS